MGFSLPSDGASDTRHDSPFKQRETDIGVMLLQERDRAKADRDVTAGAKADGIQTLRRSIEGYEVTGD